MVWSFSNHRTFNVCQRQWYFDAILANARANDPVRREAYLLSKLQELQAWRGSLIDYIISSHVIVKRPYAKMPSLEETLEIAHKTFQQQVEFARAHRLREEGIRPSKLEGQFAAWYAVEFGDGVSDEELQNCWLEIETALINFYSMSELLSLLTSANRLITQRTLTFDVDGITIQAVPDLIVFRRTQAPIIVDWKAYINDSQEHRRQLTCYALALKSCNPHSDFPASLAYCNATDIDLLEVQLLTKKQRWYKLVDDDYDAVIDLIRESAIEMQLAADGASGKIMVPERFPTAVSPSICIRCPFKALCWEV